MPCGNVSTKWGIITVLGIDNGIVGLSVSEKYVRIANCSIW